MFWLWRWLFGPGIPEEGWSIPRKLSAVCWRLLGAMIFLLILAGCFGLV